MIDIEIELQYLRKVKNTINFLQIGAYDGGKNDLNDIASKILKKDDMGVFVEPNPYIFDTLKQVKSEYKHSMCLKYAIIPDIDFYHGDFNIQKTGGGSSFIDGTFSQSPDQYEKIKVDILTVKELFDEYIKFDLDIVITDCEGYDFDINKKILEICTPKILYMEAWGTEQLSAKYNITKRSDMFEHLKQVGYDIWYNPHGENLTCILR